MQIKCPSPRRNVQAFALLTTICIVAAALIVFASILAWSLNNSQITQRNIQYNTSENAAEAAVESVIGRLDRDYIEQSVSNSSGAYTTIPLTIDQSQWPVQYAFSQTNGTQNAVNVNFGAVITTTNLNSEYTGLNGYALPVDVYAIATPVGQPYTIPATVHESIQLASIPMFQFAIFYNVNLEVMSAAGLNIYGPVFCNQNIWEGSTAATFYSTVTAVGTNAPQVNDPFCDYVGSGPSVFSLPNQPVSRASALVMPLGTNNSALSARSLLGLPPAPYTMGSSGAYTTNGLLYPANEAELVISNFSCGINSATPAGTNFAVYFQSGNLVQLPYDFYKVANVGGHMPISPTNYVPSSQYSNILYAGFTWITNTMFYDWRENYGGSSGKPVQAVQIDVSLFTLWMNAATLNGGSDSSSGAVDPEGTLRANGVSLDSIYVYTAVPTTNGSGNYQLPAVRLVNGQQLPSQSGFSVATQFPMYVKGNYNVQTPAGSCVGLYGAGSTTYTYPAAILADAITILGPNFSDSSGSMDPNVGANVTVNAAMLDGIVESDPTKTGNVGMNGDYSGGVENFLRLLENWGNNTLTYNGSIVVLFPSQYATNCWRQTGHYYSAPTRHWAFDYNFQNPNLIPPLTPQLKAMIRGNWWAHK
jgi:hypothetical protein